MVGAQNTNKSVYLTNMFCLYMTCTWKMVKVSRPSNTLCKPTLVSSTSIIISPASYRVAAGGIWGQLERWLAGHREWWAHKCFKCRQVANLFTTSGRRKGAKEKEEVLNSIYQVTRQGEVYHLPAWIICYTGNVITLRWRVEPESRVSGQGCTERSDR